MEIIDIFKEWKNKKTSDKHYKKSIRKVRNYNMEEKFENKLVFANSKVTSVFGIGTTCINEFTIAAIGEALAIFLKNNVKGYQKRGVVISHDNRQNSELFLETIVRVLEKHKINVFLFKSSNKQPSTLVSFATNKIQAAAGLTISGGKLSAKFSGVNFFGPKGKLLSKQDTNKLQKIYNNLKPLEITMGEFKYKHLNSEIEKSYINEILKLRKRADDLKRIKITFSSLNGSAGNVGVKLLQKMDINYQTVKKQTNTHKNIKINKSLSLYNKKTFSKALSLAKYNNSDLIILLSSSGISLSVAYKDNKNSWHILSANQMAALILSHLLRANKKLSGKLYQSTLSSHLTKKIAKTQNMTIIETQPGFLNLMQQVDKNKNKMVMAWEDRGCFSLSTKIGGGQDAFQAMVPIIELANYLKSQNQTFKDEFKMLDQKYGTYISEKQEKRISQNAAKRLFVQIGNIKKINGDKVVKIIKSSDQALKTSTIKIIFSSESWLATEIVGENKTQEIYFEGVGNSVKEAKDSIKNMKSHINHIILDIKKIN